MEDVMATKKDQQKVGRPAKPRGQQMGTAGNPDQNREAMKETPALRGRRKRASKMFADKSSQHVASDASKPSTNQPSVPAAIPSGVKMGDAGGEREFKQRQRKRK
ncbi:MAG: hypothetical protein AUG51_03385 [Acidobacteria bacterium 13_1_20CM_3_53_8]|nr:MAG: hypothetical protein AUG51_03385 [Acidobacteria bacterium 13_1_20CM_3_53_8]